MISAYIFTLVFFLITSDFSIHLMHFTSELQTPITSLFVNKTSSVGMYFLVRMCRIFWHQNNLGVLKKIIFAFSAPPFSVGGTLHEAYKKGARTFRPRTFRPRTFRPGHFGHGRFGHGKCQGGRFGHNHKFWVWDVCMHKCVMHFSIF